jgi:acetolactate synthase I/II/III large subunit
VTHPTRISGAASLVRALEREGIDTVFGTVGHGNLAFVDALADSSIRFVSVFHEQVAAHAADAYFRVSGRMAAVTTTVGPGFTNIATGLGDALLDSSAFVVIAGGIPNGYVGKEALQELALHVDDGQPELYRHLSKRVTRVGRAADLQHELHRAVVRARTGNPGPVILHVPLDLFSAPLLDQETAIRPFAVARQGADRDLLRQAVELIRIADRPVLFVGGGALISDAGAVLLELAERHGIPVATTMSGQGIIPENHERSVGFTGVVGTRCANDTVRRADLVIAVGTRFPEMDASSWRSEFFAEIPPTSLIQIDVDPNQIDKIYPATVGLVGDARRTLADLLEALDSTTASDRTAWLRDVVALKTSWANEVAQLRASDAFPFEPAALLTQLRGLIPDKAILVSGVGIRHAIGQHFEFRYPRTQVVGSGFGTMGQEVAAPIGVALSRPDVPVVALVGDGALLACLAALPTAVANAIDATWIVLNNRGYASIAVYQSKHFDRHKATFFEDVTGAEYEVDYAALARTFGAHASRVERPDQLAPALAEALAYAGPSVIELPVTSTPRIIGSGHWDVNDILAATPSTRSRMKGRTTT